MTDLAHLPFGTIDKPEEQGVLVLSDDGTVRVEPGDALRDFLAGQEGRALSLARTFGTHLGLVLTGLGLAGIALGWGAGRVFGKLAFRLMEPRPIRDIAVSHDGNGHLRARLYQGVWVVVECPAQEAEEFLAALKGMQHGT